MSEIAPGLDDGNYWIAFNRTSARSQFLGQYPFELAMMCKIARRVRLPNSTAKNSLEVGQCFIGASDFANMNGCGRRDDNKYRLAKKRLAKWNYATFHKATPTERTKDGYEVRAGTVATLLDSSVFIKEVGGKHVEEHTEEHTEEHRGNDERDRKAAGTRQESDRKAAHQTNNKSKNYRESYRGRPLDFFLVEVELEKYSALNNSDFRVQYSAWIGYRDEKGNKVTLAAVDQNLERALVLGSDEAIQRIKLAIDSGWQDWKHKVHAETEEGGEGPAVRDEAEVFTTKRRKK